MAKRKKAASQFDSITGILALLPWWLCLVLAAASFFYLRALAAPVSIPEHVTAAQAGELAVQTFLAMVAKIGHILVPVILLVAAGLSFFARAHRKSLLRDMEQAQSASALEGMSWREFEMLVGEAYRQRGYAVKELGGNGPDGGIDLVLTKGGEKFFVQCKQWKALKVGVDIVREMFGVMAAHGATGSFVVTSGRFTDAARQFAQGRNIELVDGPLLLSMIHQARRAPQTGHQPSQPSPTTATPASSSPSCPQCGSSMALRTARKGPNAGGSFWGCVRFPDCKGMRGTR